MEINGKKKFYYNEKKFCAEKLNFGLLPKYIARLDSWAGRWARLLGRAGAGARGVRAAGGRWVSAGRARRQVRAHAAGAGARGARGAGLAGRAAWARGLGVRPGRAAWPWAVHSTCFCPVRLGIFLSQNFWTLFVNPVHEHCSSRNFSKKNI